MTSKENSLNWFDIAVEDISRAKKFYETVFNIQMEQQEMMGMQMAMFPAEDMNLKVSGALVQSPMSKPSADGTKVYLNANPDMSDALSRIESAGGKIIMPKTAINENIGYMAIFSDSEGNTVALHSNN